MSFSEWMRKRWCVLVICAGLGAGLMSVVGDLFFYPLSRHATLVGGLVGWGVAYPIYQVDTAGL
jgi:phosphate/sulfate permease